MVKLTARQWGNARAKYETGASGNSIAEQYGVSRGTVQTRIKREGWTQDLEAVIKRKTSQKLAGLSATRSEKETVAAIDAEAEKRVVVSKRHVKLIEQAIALQQQAIGPQTGGKFNPDFSTQKSAKINAETVSILVTLERKVHRLEDNDKDLSPLVSEFRITRASRD